MYALSAPRFAISIEYHSGLLVSVPLAQLEKADVSLSI
jgi:hypothetical protein